VVEGLELDRKVTLVLHDWGSALGFHWARRNPRRGNELWQDMIPVEPDQAVRSRVIAVASERPNEAREVPRSVLGLRFHRPWPHVRCLRR
jgi:hypothetical protein